MLFALVFGLEGFVLFHKGGVRLCEVLGLLVESGVGLVELGDALFGSGEFGFELGVCVLYKSGGNIVFREGMCVLGGEFGEFGLALLVH